MSRLEPVDKRRPMRATSKQRARENRTRRKNLHARYGTQPPCAAQRPGICTGWAVDGHERLTRGRGGSIVDVDNIEPACRACHRWITEHPREALELGLVERAGRPSKSVLFIDLPDTA